MGYLQRKYVNVYILYEGRVWVRIWARLVMCICSRTTTTRIRRHAGKEHKKQNPKSRRQINLCMLVYFLNCLCLRKCLRACESICVYLCASVSMHGLPTRVRSHFIYQRFASRTLPVMGYSHLKSIHCSAPSSTHMREYHRCLPIMRSEALTRTCSI